MRTRMRTILKRSNSLDKAIRDSVPPTPNPLLWRTYHNALFLSFNSPWPDFSNSIEVTQKIHDSTLYHDPLCPWIL
jgi:hypothetical protein